MKRILCWLIGHDRYGYIRVRDNKEEHILGCHRCGYEEFKPFYNLKNK